jgi:predicted GH43/DUF377 family glycosyl hydrolase
VLLAVTKKPGQDVLMRGLHNVVYTCGAIRHGDQIILPYAVCDTFSNSATIKAAVFMQAVAN